MFFERRIRVMTPATSLEYDLRATGRPLVWKCKVGAWRIYAVLWRQGTISKEHRVEDSLRATVTAQQATLASSSAARRGK